MALRTTFNKLIVIITVKVMIHYIAQLVMHYSPYGLISTSGAHHIV